MVCWWMWRLVDLVVSVPVLFVAVVIVGEGFVASVVRPVVRPTADVFLQRLR